MIWQWGAIFALAWAVQLTGWGRWVVIGGFLAHTAVLVLKTLITAISDALKKWPG